MRFAIAALFLILASSLATAETNLARSRTRRGLSENLAAFLEKLKAKMQTGDGIPVLDPLHISRLPVKLNNELLDVQATLENVRIKGISGYNVDHTSFKLAGLKISMGFTWPAVEVNTEYDIDGVIKNLIPVYGKGHVNTTLSDLSVVVDVALSVTDSSNLYIKTISTSVSLKSLKFNITGLYHAEDVSELLGAVISDVVPEFIDDYQENVTSTVNKIIQTKANVILGNMTLSDLLGLLK